MTLASSADVLRRRFAVELPADFHARYNVCPSDTIVAVAVDRDGERKAMAMRWGFIPFWEPEPKTRISTINAKVESLEKSRLYGRALQTRRCLVIAAGFYEWRAAPTKRGSKQPFWLHRADEQPFAFAGLYSVWRPREGQPGEPVFSCAILTAPAAGVVAPIHARRR